MPTPSAIAINKKTGEAKAFGDDRTLKEFVEAETGRKPSTSLVTQFGETGQCVVGDWLLKRGKPYAVAIHQGTGAIEYFDGLSGIKPWIQGAIADMSTAGDVMQGLFKNGHCTINCTKGESKQGDWIFVYTDALSPSASPSMRG